MNQGVLLFGGILGILVHESLGVFFKDFKEMTQKDLIYLSLYWLIGIPLSLFILNYYEVTF